VNTTQIWIGTVLLKGKPVAVRVEANYLGKAAFGDKPHRWLLASTFSWNGNDYKGNSPTIRLAENNPAVLADRIMEYLSDALCSLRVPSDAPMYGISKMPPNAQIELKRDR